MINLRFISIVTLALFGKLGVAEIENSYSYTLSNSDLVGHNHFVTTSADDTLVDLAARYQLGYNVIRSANPAVDPWLPGEGTPVVLPINVILPNAEREGIIINVPEMRLYAYASNGPNPSSRVTVHPISVGRGDWTTPITKTRVTGRAENPDWYPPKSIRDEHAARGDTLPTKVSAGPDNPLGRFLLMLDIPSYFIHGTNKPFGIGMQVTHGCIRMYPDDIEQLVKQTRNNTPVTIVNQTFKTGWFDQQLYVEVHQPLEDSSNNITATKTAYINALVAATNQRPETVIDWDTLDQAIDEARGIPIKVGSAPIVQTATGG